mgnify:FL=1
MDNERMEELEKIEAHGAENGWVAPMTAEDREFFAYFRSVFKRYNITDEGVICNSKIEIQNGVMLPFLNSSLDIMAKIDAACDKP